MEQVDNVKFLSAEDAKCEQELDETLGSSIEQLESVFRLERKLQYNTLAEPSYL